MTTHKELSEQAFKMGYERGVGAASWMFDGNTTRETYEWFAKGMEEGDPEVLDRMPSAPLSGEWAGDPTIGDVLSDLGIPEDDYENPTGEYDFVFDEYERGFDEGASDEVSRVVTLQLSD